MDHNEFKLKEWDGKLYFRKNVRRNRRCLVTGGAHPIGMVSKPSSGKEDGTQDFGKTRGKVQKERALSSNGWGTHNFKLKKRDGKQHLRKKGPEFGRKEK